MSPTGQTPAGRYPDRERPGRRRGVIWASGLIGVIALGWLGWVIVDQSNPEVTSAMKSWKIIDDHTAEVSFTVLLREDDVRATCLVRALAEDHSPVGEANLKVPVGLTHQRVEGVVRTERRATSIELVGCKAPGQNSPR